MKKQASKQFLNQREPGGKFAKFRLALYVRIRPNVRENAWFLRLAVFNRLKHENFCFVVKCLKDTYVTHRQRFRNYRSCIELNHKRENEKIFHWNYWNYWNHWNRWNRWNVRLKSLKGFDVFFTALFLFVLGVCTWVWRNKLCDNWLDADTTILKVMFLQSVLFVWKNKQMQSAKFDCRISWMTNLNQM